MVSKIDVRRCTCTASETCTSCLERYADSHRHIDEMVARIRRRPSLEEIFKRVMEAES